MILIFPPAHKGCRPLLQKSAAFFQKGLAFFRGVW